MSSTKTGAKNRNEILRRAATLFYEKGFHNTAISDIAARAGVYPGTIHYHFKSKMKLLQAILADAVNAAEANFRARAHPSLDPLEELRSALSAHIDWLLKHPQIVGLVLREMSSLSPKLRHDIDRRSKHYTDRFVHTIKRGQRAGCFKRGNAYLLMQGLLGACNWIYRLHDSRKTRESDLMRDELLHFLMRAITGKNRVGNRSRRSSVRADRSGDGPGVSVGVGIA